MKESCRSTQRRGSHGGFRKRRGRRAPAGRRRPRRREDIWTGGARARPASLRAIRSVVVGGSPICLFAALGALSPVDGAGRAEEVHHPVVPFVARILVEIAR